MWCVPTATITQHTLTTYQYEYLQCAPSILPIHRTSFLFNLTNLAPPFQWHGGADVQIDVSQSCRHNYLRMHINDWVQYVAFPLR